jgi:hypothetical protein
MCIGAALTRWHILKLMRMGAAPPPKLTPQVMLVAVLRLVAHANAQKQHVPASQKTI